MSRRAAVTVVLALAITAALTSATVAVLSAYLWRPLPFPDSDRVMVVDYPRLNGPSPTALMRVDASGVAAFADLGVASDPDSFTVLGGQAPFTTAGRWIGADVFPMFAVTPVLGRVFTREEAERGAPLAMIGESTWREQFGGRADVIGRTITIRATLRRGVPETFTIVGVLPARFWHIEDRTSLLLPLPGARAPWLLRLRDGVPGDAAGSALTAIVRAQIPTVAPQWRVSMQTARDAHVAPVRPMLAATGWGVVLLAIVGLANLGCLQMARGVTRQREMAVRIFLGAGRGDLIRDVVREGAAVGSLAALLACALVFVSLQAGTTGVEQYVGRLLPVGPDSAPSSLYVITLLGTISAALVMSAIAFAASRVSAPAVALAGTASATDTPARLTARQFIVSAQIAIAFCLLVASALMIRTAWHLGHMRLGFEPRGVLSANITLHEGTLRTLDERYAFFSELAARLERLPEVEHAGLTGWLPFRVGVSVTVLPEGGDEAVAPAGSLQGVTPSYFAALQIRLRSGRFINGGDRRGVESAAVISESMARALWSGGDPLGRRFRIKLSPEPGRGFGPYIVVGVIEDVVQSLTRATPPQIYAAFHQQPIATNAFLQIRTRVEPMQAAGAIARVVREMDPNLPLGAVNTLDAIVDADGLRPRLLARALAGIAILAVVIAMIGLYAVSAWIAHLRQREAALRVALGADRQSVAAMLARRGVIAIAAGLALGWIAALPMAALIAPEVRGVSSNDPTTRIAVALLLTAVSAIALFGPAWRASTRDLAVLLRSE